MGDDDSITIRGYLRQSMQREKLDLAILAYMQRKTDLRGGAAMAGVSYNRFLKEVQARNIVVLEEQGFLERLQFLADTFDDAALRSAIQKVLAETSD